MIRFDNGAGKTLQKTLRSGTYRLAVSGSGSLDLFPADAVKAPVPVADLARKRGQAEGNLFADGRKITPHLFESDQPEKTPEKPSEQPPAAPKTPSLFGDAK